MFSSEMPLCLHTLVPYICETWNGRHSTDYSRRGSGEIERALSGQKSSGSLTRIPDFPASDEMCMRPGISAVPQRGSIPHKVGYLLTMVAKLRQSTQVSLSCAGRVSCALAGLSANIPLEVLHPLVSATYPPDSALAAAYHYRPLSTRALSTFPTAASLREFECVYGVDFAMHVLAERKQGVWLMQVGELLRSHSTVRRH